MEINKTWTQITTFKGSYTKLKKRTLMVKGDVISAESEMKKK